MMVSNRIRVAFLFMLCLGSQTASLAQSADNSVYVDKEGILRWQKSKEEIHGFGVNYTVPFAHGYKTAQRMNVNMKEAISNDVYHFSRLGFDLYRVHVWDTEISDSVGNLLNNDHLMLFDFMLNEMKARGMKFVITPIAFWGNGWPEPDTWSPGFSRKYGKGACLTNPEAIAAQEKYLYQFLNHVNTFTGIAYKNDPDIIAFEISNEPHHGEAPEKVTAFIEKMVKSMRSTGYKKPIFYNVSHSIHLSEAYYKAGIQGGTFQWYPTGLGSGHELGGNQLQNVDKYVIPFAQQPSFKKGAKIVYEFDAADVGRSYIYPAMARSFRTTGIQLATHFAYDPTYMAASNTEYGTHYMNLAYAPQKALSLKIASAVFHRVPVYKDFGSYPGNTTFDVFKVSYERDLAEMVTPEEFIYTNNTTTAPPSPDKLERISGFGSSPVVSYEGAGAYFLDKVEDGVWRLEVMPDAIWIRDPFEPYSPSKEVSVINYRRWPMTISLTNLGEDYTVKGINEGNTDNAKATGKTVTIRPGTWLVSRKGVTPKVTAESPMKNGKLKEFSAPLQSLKKAHIVHTPPPSMTKGGTITFTATIATPEEPESVELTVQDARWQVLKMQRTGSYTYAATFTDNLNQERFLKYYITVTEKGGTHTFPSGIEGRPGAWDFYDRRPYEVPVLDSTDPLCLFDAVTDSNILLRQWNRGSYLKPTSEPGKAEQIVSVEKLFTEDPENRKAEKRYDYSFVTYTGNKTAGRQKDLAAMKRIVFRGKSLDDKGGKVQLALIMKDGTAFGGVVDLGTKTDDYSLSLSDLRRVKMVTLPRPYPTFLPYYFESTATNQFDLSEVEKLQFSIGPGLPPEQMEGKHAIAIERVTLEP